MNENIVKLLQKVAEDEALQEKMKSFTDPEEAYEFARTIQDGFTKEEFVKAITELAEEVFGDGELTDEYLALAAGGWTGDAEDIATLAVTTLSGTAIAAASLGGI